MRVNFNSTVTLPRGPVFRIPAHGPRVALSSLARRPLLNWVVLWTFLAYAGICVVVFFALVRPWIDGQTNIRIGADSDIYWMATDILHQGPNPGALPLLSFGGNYLGPVAMATLVKTQLLVMACDFLFFYIALRVGGGITGVNKSLLLALLLINSETAVSLITLNKEIFVTLSAMLAARYLYAERRSWLFLGLVIVAALLARWEEAAVIVVCLFFRRYRFFGARPGLCVALFIAGLTVAYPLLILYSGADVASFTRYANGGNTIVVLNNMQAHFGFPVVLLPKVAMVILGRWITPWYFLGDFWTSGVEDIHSLLVVPQASLALVLLLVLAWRKGRLRLDRPVPFLIVLYVIVTAVTPFIQPRYEYFVYVLLCVELAQTNLGQGRRRAVALPPHSPRSEVFSRPLPGSAPA